MNSTIQSSDVRPGNILLYRANSPISWAIRVLDGTEVSHAGLCLGNEIAEALIKEGLTRRPISVSIAGCDWVEVRRLRAAVRTMSPVLAVAEAYLNDRNRYAYEQIILLAGICMTRKLDLHNPLLRKIVRMAMEQATRCLEYFHGQGKEPMICSEFVYRAFDKALPGPDDPYSLEILSQAADEPQRHFSRFRRRRRLFSGQSPRDVPNVHPESLLAQLQATGETPERLPSANTKMAAAPPASTEELESMIEQYQAEVEGTKATGQTVTAAGPEVSTDELLDSTRQLTAEWAETTARKDETETKLYGAPAAPRESTPRTLVEIFADFVTPGDLLKSPSLTTIGRLEP